MVSENIRGNKGREEFRKKRRFYSKYDRCYLLHSLSFVKRKGAGVFSENEKRVYMMRSE